MNKYQITVTADHNDGDYVTENTVLTEEKLDLDRLKRVCAALESKRGTHNWNRLDYRREYEQSPEQMYEGILPEQDVDWFGDFVPYAEYGVHSIATVTVTEIAAIQRLY